MTKMLRLAVPLVAVALALAQVAAAGGGGGDKKDAKKEPAHGSSASPGKQRSITTLESWVSVDPMTVLIVQDDMLRGKVSVAFGMDVLDPALRGKAELLMPRLQDAWLMGLNHYAATYLRPQRPANIDDFSRELQSTADKVLGKPGAKVLMGSVIIRMD